MTKQKRMIYIYEENLDYYDEIENKSEFINEALKQARLKKPHLDPNNIDYVKRKLAEMEALRNQRVQ